MVRNTTSKLHGKSVTTAPVNTISRRAAELDTELEALLDAAGQLAPQVANPRLRGARQRSARVERLRVAMRGVDRSLYPEAVRLWEEAEALRWELAMAAAHLAEREARRIRIPELTREDVVGECMRGLYEAAKRFDPELGFRFSTYARWWVRAQAKSAVAGARRSVRLPDSALRQRARVMRVAKRLTSAGKESRERALADATGLTSRRVGRLLSSFSSVALHRVDDHGYPLEETLPDSAARSPDLRIADEEDLTLLERALSTSIDGRHLDVVRARFGLDGAEPRTLQQIGRSMGVSSERVRQIERESLDVLKDAILRAASPPRARSDHLERVAVGGLRRTGRNPR